MPAITSIDQIVRLSRDLAGWLFTWSWQMLLVLAAAWIAVKLDRSRSAATRYRVWLIAIMISATLPLLNYISETLPGPIVPAPLPVINFAAAPPTPTVTVPIHGFSWTSLVWPALILLWAAGAIVQLIRLCGSYWKLRTIKRAAQLTTVPGSLFDRDSLTADLPLMSGRPVPVILSSQIQSPGLAGLLRPVILLPADMASWTSTEERASILRHEFAHISRRDHLASLFQSVLNALFFFHPMLRYSSSQLSLERELACDDRVLSLGTEAPAYAESILKAAERSFITDVVHQAASFASKRKLERRIDMILDPNRLPRPLRQWPFLVLPLMLMAIITWLVMPAASARPAAAVPASESGGAISAPTRLASGRQSRAEPVVDRQAIWADTVKRGPLVIQVRALGTLKQDADGRFLADLRVPEVVMRQVDVGLPASVDTRIGVVSGKVFRIHGQAKDGVVRVDIILEGELPAGAGSGHLVDGMIEVGRLDDVLYVGRTVHGQEESTITLFKIADDGLSATRVRVQIGKASANSVQILDGLNPGDKVIISDMSAYDAYDKVTLK